MEGRREGEERVSKSEKNRHTAQAEERRKHHTGQGQKKRAKAAARRSKGSKHLLGRGHLVAMLGRPPVKLKTGKRSEKQTCRRKKMEEKQRKG